MSHSFGSFTWFTSFHWTNSIAYLNQSSKTDVDLCVTTRAAASGSSNFTVVRSLDFHPHRQNMLARPALP